MSALANSKHEQFCQLIVDGMGAVEAHGEVGFSGKPAAASLMRSRPDISARIAELNDRRAKIAERATERAIERAVEKRALSKEYVLNNLMRIVDESVVAMSPSEGKFNPAAAGSANKALQLLGQHLGLYVTRTEVGMAGDFVELSSDGLKQMVYQRIAMMANQNSGLVIEHKNESDD